MHTRWKAWLIGGLVLTGMCLAGAVGRSEVVPVGVFSEMDLSQELPDGWTEGALAAAYKKTEYKLVRSDRGSVVRAQSRDGASFLATERRVDLATHPILEWHWKIESIIEEGRVRVEARDDTPANLYVTFDHDGLSLFHRLRIMAMYALGYDAIPKRALVYTWANEAAVNTAFPNPKAPWLYQVIVQSGPARAGTWQTERRNVRADYRRVFGEEPPPVQRIAFITDTETTDSEVTAYYGDVVFRAASSDSLRVDTTLRVRSDNPK